MAGQYSSRGEKKLEQLFLFCFSLLFFFLSLLYQVYIIFKLISHIQQSCLLVADDFLFALLSNGLLICKTQKSISCNC